MIPQFYRGKYVWVDFHRIKYFGLGFQYGGFGQIGIFLAVGYYKIWIRKVV